MRKNLYLLLAVVGGIVPYLYFLQFFGSEGLNLGGFVAALFVNGAAGGFTADLLISSLVLWIFIFAESRRLGMKNSWAYVIINLTIGLSCALPLFLYFREDRVANGR